MICYPNIELIKDFFSKRNKKLIEEAINKIYRNKTKGMTSKQRKKFDSDGGPTGDGIEFCIGQDSVFVYFGIRYLGEYMSIEILD